ncbi:MAG: hypothetical protein RL839_05675 [Gammaproteobacteria bacterium]
MAISTFDTLKFVRRLEQAGMPSELAEVHADVLTEAFNVNLDSLVTKEYLAAELAKVNARIDANFRILLWMIGIVQAFVILPYIERLLAL